MMKDIHSQMNVQQLLDPEIYAADADSGWIDLKGYHGAEIILNIGVGGITFSTSNKVEFTLQFADVSDGTGAVNAVDADVLGVTGVTTGILKSLIAAHAAATVSRFGLRTFKRYMKFKADFTGTHGTGTGIAAMLVQSVPQLAPVAAQA